MKNSLNEFFNFVGAKVYFYPLVVFVLLTTIHVLKPRFGAVAVDPYSMQEKWESGEIGVLWPKILFFFYAAFSFLSEGEVYNTNAWAAEFYPQIIVVSLVLGWVIYKLQKLGLNSTLSFFLLIILTLYPPYLKYNLNLEKDTIAVMMVLLLFIHLFELAKDSQLVQNPQFMARLGIALWLVYEVRTNNIVIVVFVLVALLLTFRTQLKNFFPVLVVFVVLTASLQIAIFATGKKVTNVGLQDVMGVEAVAVSAIYNQNSLGNAANIPQDLNNYFTSLGKEKMHSEIPRSDADWAAIYDIQENHYISDDARLGLKNPWNAKQVLEFKINSAKLCALNFGICLKAWYEYQATDFNPLAVGFNYFNQPLNDVWNKYTGSSSIVVAVAKFFIYLVERYICYNYALQFWFFLAFGVYLLKQNKKVYAISTLIPFGCWLSLFIFAPVHQTRYFLPLIYLFPIFITFATRLKKDFVI